MQILVKLCVTLVAYGFWGFYYHQPVPLIALGFWVFYSPELNAKTFNSWLTFPAANNCSQLIPFLLTTYIWLIRVLICWLRPLVWWFVICFWPAISGDWWLFCCVGWFMSLLLWVRLWFLVDLWVGWTGAGFRLIDAEFHWPSMLSAMLSLLSPPFCPFAFKLLTTCHLFVSNHLQSPPTRLLQLRYAVAQENYPKETCFGSVDTGRFKPPDVMQLLDHSSWYFPDTVFCCPRTSLYCPDWVPSIDSSRVLFTRSLFLLILPNLITLLSPQSISARILSQLLPVYFETWGALFGRLTIELKSWGALFGKLTIGLESWGFVFGNLIIELELMIRVVMYQPRLFGIEKGTVWSIRVVAK